MKEITFFRSPYADDARCEVFQSGARRGIALHVNTITLVDAWLDEGEDPVAAEQLLRDMCVLRQGST